MTAAHFPEDPGYAVEPVYADPGPESPPALVDLVFRLKDKTWRLWGRQGPEREEELARTFQGQGLPVLIGSGLGAGLRRLLADHPGPVAVVDRERAVLAVTGVREAFRNDPRVCWVDEADPQAALAALLRWQERSGGAPLVPLPIPLYYRLDPGHYRSLALGLAAARDADFWTRAAYPKFATARNRVLVLRRPYFLYPEIGAALDRLGVEARVLDIGAGETGREGFVEELLRAVLDFRPDFLLTVNHLGLDREGRLAGLLARLRLPLASWFVDNPHLILHQYPGLANPWTVVFTWDRDTVASMRGLGFEHVFHLPLGTDHTRFKPGRPLGPGLAPAVAAALGGGGPLDIRVAFVGHSMLDHVRERFAAGRFPEVLARGYKAAAAAFAQAPEGSVPDFLARAFPDLHAAWQGLPDPETRLHFEALVTWEATRAYRADCVRRLFPFQVLVAGDLGWKAVLGAEKGWRHHPGLDYFQDLPGFYQRTPVNFNCTSVQMKGAVNQRVFDAPAAGGFVLTDWREQLEDLFEPGREAVCYHGPEEIGDLCRTYLEDPAGRARVAAAGRARVLACHTYDHRLREMLAVMGRVFG